MTEPGAVIFDCDGVLVDSEPHSVAAWLDVLDSLGHPGAEADVAACTGLGFTATRSRLVDVAPLPPVAELWPRLLAALERSFATGLARFEDAIDVLGAVEARALPVAVASASPRQRLDATLEAAGLSARFDVSVAGDEVLRGKPDPDVYLEALRLLGVAPADALAIEDTVAGVTSARRAGMTVVAVAREPGFRSALAEAGAQVVDRLDAAHVGV